MIYMEELLPCILMSVFGRNNSRADGLIKNPQGIIGWRDGIMGGVETEEGETTLGQSGTKENHGKSRISKPLRRIR